MEKGKAGKPSSGSGGDDWHHASWGEVAPGVVCLVSGCVIYGHLRAAWLTERLLCGEVAQIRTKAHPVLLLEFGYSTLSNSSIREDIERRIK
jgi:hypothetical protein